MSVSRPGLRALVLSVALGTSVIAVPSAASATVGVLVQPYHGAGRFTMHVVKPCPGLPDLAEDATLDIVDDRVRLDIVGIPLLTGPVNGLRFDVEDGSTFRLRGVFVDGPTQRGTFLVYLPGCTGRGDVTIGGLDPPVEVSVPRPSASPSEPTPSPSATPSLTTPSEAPSEATTSTAPFVAAIAIGIALVVAGIVLLLAYRATLPTIEEVARAVIEADTSTVGKQKRKGQREGSDGDSLSRPGVEGARDERGREHRRRYPEDRLSCPNCGSSCRIGSLYCWNCGHDLGGVEIPDALGGAAPPGDAAPGVPPPAAVGGDVRTWSTTQIQQALDDPSTSRNWLMDALKTFGGLDEDGLRAWGGATRQQLIDAINKRMADEPAEPPTDGP